MEKKILKAASVIIGVIFIIVGLMEVIGDSVKKDLLDYVNNRVVGLTTTEAKILASYGAVTGENYRDDKTLHGSLHDTIIPQYSAFVDTLKSIKPKTKEVQTLHEKYISGAEIQLAGFKEIQHAIEKEDVKEVADANVKLEEAKKIFAGYNTTLDSLATKHDVKLIRNEKK